MADLNGWSKLGNWGWSWYSFLPYFLRAEKYTPADQQQAQDLEINLDPRYHGDRGPIQTSFPPSYGNLAEAWNPTFAQLNLQLQGDPYAGRATGSYTTLITQNRANATRSYAANAYYQPNANRPNLKVLTKAYATKVLFRDGVSPLEAIGVTFTSANRTYTVKANREVILAAGVVQSPQLLELSGIGDKNLLNQHNITTLVHNPNVGENLQDHQFTSLSFQAADGVPTTDGLRDPAARAQAILEFQQNAAGPLTQATSSTAYLSLAQLIRTAKQPSHNPLAVPGAQFGALDREAARGLARQYALIAEKLFDPNEPAAQIIYSAAGIVFPPPPGNFITLFGLLAHPFSRGSIHINSSDPAAPPIIDPRFLSHPLDVELLSTIAFTLQTIADTAPFNSFLKRNATNGLIYAPGNARLYPSNVHQHVRSTLGEFQHPLGTCSMAPRNEGGVVDPQLRVYGAKNLRVVDASVIPLQPVGTIVSLVYAIAEKAADIIKSGY